MHTSAAALELDFTEPSITAANAVFAKLRKGDSVDRPGLLRTMETRLWFNRSRWALVTLRRR